MALTLLFAVISTVHATSFFAQPFEKTLNDAPVIIRGTIGAGQSRYSTYTDGTKQLFTFTEVEVKDRLKGAESLPSKIEIREIGGEKDGVEMGVSGRAEFSVGEDVVLLLNQRAKDGSYPLKGLMMGKYNIEKDRGGNEILKGAGIDSARGHEHDSSESMGETPKIWTIKAVRELIAEHKAESRGATSASISKPETVLSPTPSGVIDQKKEEIHESSVSQPDEAKGEHSNLKIGLKFLFAFLIGGGFYLLKRKRS